MPGTPSREIKVGAPTLTVNFYTRDKVYELHSKIGDPNTAILSVTTSKDLGSPAGSFTIAMVPESDERGKTWKDKLEVFDYVEIFMKGIDDPSERIIMRGLIDTISMEEDYSGDVPTRNITLSGRDLGALFVDFSVWYSPLLDAKAALGKMATWIKEKRPQGYSAEELFKEFFDHMTNLFELTVGKPTYSGTTGWGHSINARTQRNVVVSPSSTVNLSAKIERKIKAFFPELRTTYLQFNQFEGSYWNLFQNYQDKPFHEMFVWDADDTTKFVFRPARLKDMKSNFHDNVLSAMEELGMAAYPPDFSVNDADKISMSTKQSVSQLNNYFFTFPELQGGQSKTNMMSVAVLSFVDNPSESVNPFLSIRPPLSAAELEGTTNLAGNEPMAFIGRYGRRAYEVPIHFFLQDIGQILQSESKDPAHPLPDPLAAKFKALPYNQSDPTGKGVSRWENKVEKYSKKNNATKPLVYAILDKSSGGDNLKKEDFSYTLFGLTLKKESTSVGLMQINSKMDPAYVGGTDSDMNLDYGTAKISRLEQKYGGDKKKVIAAYFGGNGHSERAVDNAITRAGTSGKDWFQELPNSTMFKDQGIFLQKWTNETLALTAQYYLKLKPDEGYRSPQAEKELQDKNAGASRSAMSLLKDPYIGPALRFNFILVCWYLHNHYLLSGSMSIRGTNKAIIGTYVQDKDGEYLNLDGSLHRGMEYYVEGVSHNFVVFSRYTTTLTIERGQPEQYGLYGQGYRGKWYFNEGIVPTSFRQKKFAPPPTKKPETSQTEQVPTKSAKFIPLPKETPGCGYVYYGDADKRFGRPDTISAIVATCANWYRAYPSGPRLQIGDISLKDGGPCPGHPVGHQNGNECDVRPLRTDGVDVDGKCTVQDPKYNKNLTQDAVTAFRNNGMRNVRIVLFGDNTVSGITYDKSGLHNNHFHVGFQGEGKVANVEGVPSQDNRLPFPQKDTDGTPVPQTLDEAIKALKKKESSSTSGDGDYLYVGKTGMYYSPDRVTGKVSGNFVGYGTSSTIRWSDSKFQRTVKVEHIRNISG